MEIRHAQIDNTMTTVQLMRATCPKCHNAVEFILCEDDRQFKEDAEYYEKLYGKANLEIHRLRKIIDQILERNPK